MDRDKRVDRIAFFIELALKDERWVAFHKYIPMLTPVRWTYRGTIQHGLLAGGKNSTLTTGNPSYWTHMLYVFPDGKDSEEMHHETELEYFIDGVWRSYQEAMKQPPPVSTAQEMALLVAQLKEQNRQLRKMAVNRVVVPHQIVWLAEHYPGVEYPSQDREEGCLFWMSEYPEGFNQPFDDTLFVEDCRAGWDKLLTLLNTCKKEGYYAIRLINESRLKALESEE